MNESIVADRSIEESLEIIHTGIDRILADRSRLLEALKTLRNEAIGAIATGVSDSIGEVSAKCLEEACQVAREAIVLAEAR